MAKVSLDLEQAKALKDLKVKIDEAETACVEERELTERLARVREVAETLDTLRAEWDTAIADFPEEIRVLLENPKVRAQIRGGTKKKQGGKASGETAKWLKQTLAAGPMTEKELRAAGTGEADKAGQLHWQRTEAGRR